MLPKRPSSSSSSSTTVITAVSIILNVIAIIYLFRSMLVPCVHPPDEHIPQSRNIMAGAGGRRLLSDDAPPPLPIGKIFEQQKPSPLLTTAHDLSLNTSFDIAQHDVVWRYCAINADSVFTTAIPFCEQTPNSEQKYQMSWFGTHVVPGLKRPAPNYQKCVHLPPADYRWPTKNTQLPATQAAVHWPNLRVHSQQDLVVFNRATPKNLYHFDAVKYDQDALSEVAVGAKHIPFAQKIRNLLDIGAGGGSLGLILKRKYDVQVLSTVFADWPYCEYITERGGLCMLVDVMEAMPFAKYTWDVIHISWVYHGQQSDELIRMFNEINRLIRPAGYVWMRGGWSKAQVQTLRTLLVEQFGYTMLLDEIKEKPVEISQKINFGPAIPYEIDWNMIAVKPIRATQRNDCPPFATPQNTTPIAHPEGAGGGLAPKTG